MRIRLCFLVVTFLYTGCGKTPMPQSPTNGEPNQLPKAQVKIGDDQDEARHLALKITAVHEKQKLSKEAPFYTKGGDWTFFDCLVSSDPSVVFTVGVLRKSAADNVPSAWGKALLIVKNREVGARFVELFAKAFGGKLPKSIRQAHVIERLAINTAILGHYMNREDKGGFSGERGNWTATKWFPEHDGLSGEVYFNYNLASRQGEFSEKDPDYADDLVAIFASAFRDGPRPERTPENDPNLTRIGPKIGRPHKLLPRLASHYSFSPKGKFAVFQDRETIVALTPNQADGKPFEIIRFDHSPWTLHVVDEDLNLVVQEGIPEIPSAKSSADPMRIWWVDGKKHQKKLLRGPEKDLNLAEHPFSPDQRYIVLSQWQGDPRKEGRSKVLFIFNRETGKTSICKSKKKGLSVIGWKQIKGGLRLAVISNRWLFDKNETSELYLADPANGALERQENVDARFEVDNPVSPDGKHRVHVGKDELVVTDVASGKQSLFAFHEDDHRFVCPECIDWVNPLYLKFNGPRLALIDVTTMKMCFPSTADGAKLASHAFTFSPDFRWVMYQGETSDGEGLFLAPIEMPKEP